MKRLTFKPIEEALDVRTDSPLLQALLAKQLNVLMACGGKGLCATCHVHVRKGAENLTPRTERERRTLEFVSGTDANSRLACQTRVCGDAEVELPRGMFIERAEDLLGLLGTRAPADVLHPVRGNVLVSRGKIITRSVIEALRSLNVEVRQLLPEAPAPAPAPPPPEAPGVELPFSDPQPSRVAEREAAAKPPSTRRLVSAGAEPPPAEAGPAEVKVGTLLGKYLLLERIGQGGSGVVFRALHKTLNVAVAVKLLQIADEADQEVYRKLRCEAQLLAQLNHPNIVRVWDFEEDQVPYLVLELVEGLSLAELIDQSGRIRPDRVVSIMLQVAEALAAAWKVGIVHRDVKPGNILLSRDGVAKLADLGLAMTVKPEGQRAPSATPAPMEGTVAYMSPEQAEASDAVDFRTDIYALGATFYHALTGRLPFRGRTRVEVMLKHRTEELEEPHHLVPELSPAVSAVILRMMAKRPEARHSSYASLIADLERLQDSVEATGPVSAVVGGETSAAGDATNHAETNRSLWKVLISSFGRKKTGKAP